MTVVRTLGGRGDWRGLRRRRGAGGRRAVPAAVALAVALVAAACNPLPPPPVPAPDRTEMAGFAVGQWILWEDDASLQRDLDGMAATGARWLRIELHWDSIQAAGPDSYRWAVHDRVVTQAAARGFRIVLMPLYTPAWARPAGTDIRTPPTDPQDFARFVRAAVRRYRAYGVRHWELWNEPNLTLFWAPAPDAAAFTSLLCAGYGAAKAADPGATVISGGMAPAKDSPGWSIGQLRFLGQMYDAGAQGCFDHLGMHPYNFPWDPSIPEAWNSLYTLPYLWYVMDAHGDGDKQIWATEAGGYPTGTMPLAIPESQQPGRITETLDIWNSYTFVGPYFWYEWRDQSCAPEVWIDAMGLVRCDHSPKPGRDAFVNAING